MEVTYLNIPGVFSLKPDVFKDSRGSFMQSYSASEFNEVVGESIEFVQDNHSVSTAVGTVRGLHFQSPPFEQGKLVRCVVGRVLDVIVDVRVGSPTYGHYLSVELSADNAVQLWVPPGFLHGFSTLMPNSEFVYKVTNPYSYESEGSVLWNDSSLRIDWQIDTSKASVSSKDRNAMSFSDFISPFTY